MPKLQPCLKRGSLDDTDLVAAVWTGESERWNAPSRHTQAGIAGWAVDFAVTVQPAFIVTQFRNLFFWLRLVFRFNIFLQLLLVAWLATEQASDREHSNQPPKTHHGEGDWLTDGQSQREGQSIGWQFRTFNGHQQGERLVSSQDPSAR